MILLALLLASIGAADLVRPQDTALTRRGLARAVIVSVAVAGLGVWGCGLAWWWAAIGLALVLGWLVTTPSSTVLPRSHPWPLVALTGVVLALLASSGEVPAPAGWLTDWYASLEITALDTVPFERFAVVAGALVFLVDSANIIVRMVLAATDAGVMASEQSLRGGRVLGPIERIIIFAMALSGEYAALTAVVAAKGILRFPEISRDVAGRKAEYVLVGSFVSWGLALVLVPLL